MFHKLMATAALFLLAIPAAFAGVDTATDRNGVILAGYDAVAYFTEGKAVRGSEEFTASHGGANYQFASAEHRDLFAADPERYAPAYGGYCALGASFGKKFLVDGKAFEIVDGQLYVNKNLKVYATWKKDIPGNIEKADAKWPAIADVPAKKL
ncbi:MAG: YHS domain-containing (seleno)protein [Pseudomonadota bacterium]